VGTETYTSIGRPVVKSVTVEGNVESISDSDKILVFKKKRRKQYRRSYGSRVPLTTVRITNIVHNLTS
jgi:large subunit ribosomal protein L21